MTVMWFRPDVRCPPTSRALGAAEALVDPVQGLHPVGRVDALGREHPHAREHVLIPLRVELDRPVERVLDGLVTAADRHRDAPAGRVELQILEGPNHVVRARPPSGSLDRLFVRGLHALKGLHHVVAPVGRPARLAELLRATLDELPLERVPGGVGHLGPVRSPEAHDEAVGQVPKLLEEERRVVVNDEALAEEPANSALAVHRGEVRPPETVEDHVGLGGEELRDLGRQVTLEELRPKRLDHLDVRLQLAEGAAEDLPRVPTPRVVLVEARNGLHVGLRGQEIAGRADPVDAGVRGGAEHVLVLGLLEDARGPAVEEDREEPELLGHRGHGHAVGARDVTDDQVYLLVGREPPELGDHLVAEFRRLAVRTGTTFTPPIPPASLIFSTQASAAFLAGMPKVLEAGPESSVTMPTRSSLGAPFGAGPWAAAGGDRTAISAITLMRRVFIMLSQWLVGGPRAA